MIEHAASFRKRGRYLIEAMIAALHCEAKSWDATDWAQNPGVVRRAGGDRRLTSSRAEPRIAQRYVEGPAAALATVNQLAEQLKGYHLFHATRAALLRDLGQPKTPRHWR